MRFVGVKNFYSSVNQSNLHQCSKHICIDMYDSNEQFSLRNMPSSFYRLFFLHRGLIKEPPHSLKLHLNVIQYQEHVVDYNTMSLSAHREKQDAQILCMLANKAGPDTT